MATSRKRANEGNDFSMEEKILALYELQKIDSQIDEINKIKGELPLEVADLEDEVAGLQTRIDNIQSEIENLNLLSRQRKEEMETSKNLITKYTEQQNSVRNNREFDSLTKEIEYQSLEIELSEKRLKEHTAEIKIKKKQVEDSKAIIDDRKIDLENKKTELASIDNETQKEVEELNVKSEKTQLKIDERLLTAYKRIRNNMINGLAVVTVKRDACGGCFNRIPPQRQYEIRTNKKVIVCEYCGRILVSNISDTEE